MRKSPALLWFGVVLLQGIPGAGVPDLAAEETDPSPDPPMALRWHWQTGKTYQLQTSTDTTMSLEALGRSGNQTLNATQTTRIEVLPLPGTDDKRLHVTYETMLGEMSAGGNTYRYDSTDPEGSYPALAEMLKGSVGQTFDMRYSGEDRFLELEQAEQPAATPGEPPGLMAIANAREVAELFRRSIEMGLPRPDVQVGDQWTSVEHIKFPQAGDMEVQLKCQFESVVEREERPHAKIVFEGEMNQSAAQIDNPLQAPAVSLGSGSTLSGQIFFDLERKVVSVSVFLSNLLILQDGVQLPVRQSVTSRLLEIRDSEAGDASP